MNRWQLIQSALLSSDEEVRLSGLHSLYHCPGEERLDLLCAALGDVSWRIRKEAVNLFLSLPDASTSAWRIVALLYDGENAGLRNAAAEILVKLDSSVLPTLLKAADSPDHDVRKFILDILGDRGDSAVSPLLLRLLKNDPETNVRAAAAENLGKVGDVHAVPAMVEALSDPDLLVQFSLLDALGRIGCTVPLAGLVGLGENRLLRKPLFTALGRIGDESAIPILAAGLSDPMRNVREAAVLALESLVSRCGEASLRRQLPTAALEGALALLSNPTLAVQRAALIMLAIDADPDRALLLASYLDDDQLGDEIAALLLAKGSEFVGALTACWKEASERKKTYLAYLFGETGVVKATPLLVAELKGADDFLRTVLLRALGQVGGKEEIMTLAGYLDVSEDDVRQAAVDGLVKIAERFHQPVIDLVQGAIAHIDPLVRQSALQVLGRLGGGEAEVALLMAMKDESSAVRRTAISYLDGRNPRHHPLLTLALTDEESEVRRQAIEALAMSTDRSLIEPITLVLNDEDPWVRASAIRALGRFGGIEALAAVRSALHDPVGLVTIAAVEILIEEDLPFDPGDFAAQLGHADDDVVFVLLKLLARSPDHAWLGSWGERLLSHRHSHVRQSMAELLSQAGTTAGGELLRQRLSIEEDDEVRDSLRRSLAPSFLPPERD